MLRIATCRAYPNLFPEEQPLIQLLADRGVEAMAMPWQDIEPGEPVLIRTTWDYTADLGAFVSWLGKLEASNTKVFNPIPLMMWNMDKRYLLDLQAQGHPIVPTLCMEFDPDAIWAFAKRKGWEAAIAKPVRGCGAEGLVKISKAGVEEFDLAGNSWAPDAPSRPEGVCLVQPFMAAIGEGEWSLFYFGGTYSHAVRKYPADGDIRVQEEHGGRSEGATPPEHVIAAADLIMKAVPEALVARVDGIEVEQHFRLMELELIEPELYVRYATGSLERFANAIAGAIKA